MGNGLFQLRWSTYVEDNRKKYEGGYIVTEVTNNS